MRPFLALFGEIVVSTQLTHYYGPAQGPLGFPMTDRQARMLDTLLKSMPKSQEFAYRKGAGRGSGRGSGTFAKCTPPFTESF